MPRRLRRNSYGRGFSGCHVLGELSFCRGKHPVAGHRDCADNENADKPDEHSDDERHDGKQLITAQDLVADSGVVEQCDRDTPPRECGVHGGGEEPSTQEIPDLQIFGFASFGREQAGDAGEVHAAEGERQNHRPTDAQKANVSEQVGEGEVVVV